MIHLGHRFQSSDIVQRGEGVTIVLDPATSWRDLGPSWSTISSRIVFARLQLCLSDSSNYHCKCLCPYPLGTY